MKMKVWDVMFYLESKIYNLSHSNYFLLYRSIFDVNIDTLEEKPWRTPGVDVTDYFNFGFDEDTWKHYCASLVSIFCLKPK